MLCSLVRAQQQGFSFALPHLTGVRSGLPVAQPCRKNYVWSFNVPNPRDIIKLNKERKAQGKFGRLVAMDISNGLEKVSHGSY